MAQIKRLLVPTDFSPASDVAFSYALDLGRSQRSSIHLLHVIDDATFAAAYPDGYYVELPGLRAQLMDEARTRLVELADRCTHNDLHVTTEVAVGRPARVIVESATVRGTDLIVMGTHGRSGFAHLVIGSVAERVVRTAPCPVLTVREAAPVHALEVEPRPHGVEVRN